MTSDRDFDRLARAWLELGPDQAPDRVVAAVLQAAETMPQARRPVRWPFRKDFQMTRLPVLATVAATLVVVVGGLFLINRPNGGVGGPTASPSPSAIQSSGSPAVAPLDVALRSSRWMGSERPVPGILASAGTIINFTADNQFSISQSAGSENHYLNSVASSVGDGQFQLETTGTGGGPCSTGDIGRYSWSVAPSGRILTIEPSSDDCPTRLGAVPGTWWLEACKNPDNYCLGDLDTGYYKSQYFTPRLGAGAQWAPDFGALTYWVPDGWANSADFPDRFRLKPAVDFALETSGSPSAHEIELHWQSAANAQNANCTSEELGSVPRTVDGLADWIRTLPSLDTSEPSTVTIHGHPGRRVDVRVAPSWTASCPGETQPVALFLTQAGDAGDAFAIVGSARARLVFLDLGGGDIVMISMYSADPARFESLVAQGMPVVENFLFE